MGNQASELYIYLHSGPEMMGHRVMVRRQREGVGEEKRAQLA